MTFSPISFIMVSSSTARDSKAAIATLARLKKKKKKNHNEEDRITLDKSKIRKSNDPEVVTLPLDSLEYHSGLGHQNQKKQLE